MPVFKTRQIINSKAAPHHSQVKNSGYPTALKFASKCISFWLQYAVVLMQCLYATTNPRHAEKCVVILQMNQTRLLPLNDIGPELSDIVLSLQKLCNFVHLAVNFKLNNCNSKVE